MFMETRIKRRGQRKPLFVEQRISILLCRLSEKREQISVLKCAGGTVGAVGETSGGGSTGAAEACVYE